nr:MAG TPA: hypothetical protein [Caudoviricetes sp.]
MGARPKKQTITNLISSRLNSDQPRAKGRLNSDGLCLLERIR